MSLLSATDLSLAYGEKVLFEDASFTVGPHDRVGVIGANGTGKSSLLRIIAGTAQADGGALTWRRGARAGYLPQDVAELPDLPLTDYVLSSVPGRAVLEARLHATESARVRKQRRSRSWASGSMSTARACASATPSWCGATSVAARR